MKLISDCRAIGDRVGMDPIADLLAPGIRLDAPKAMTPVLVDRDEGTVLLVREQDRGNVEAAAPEVADIRFFERYVSFDNMVHGSSAALSLSAAVVELADGGAVEVGSDLPFSRYRHLRKALGAALTQPPMTPGDRITARRIPAGEVLERFARFRADSESAAERILGDRPHLSGLLGEIERAPRDHRFERLDAKLADAGADAAFVCSPPNVSQFLGLPADLVAGALYGRGAGDVIVLLPGTTTDLPGSDAGSYESLAEAVLALVPRGHLAVEDAWLGCGLALALEQRGLELVDSTGELSLWREEGDATDLALMVIVAQASRFCIEGALDYAARQLDAGVPLTEKDVASRHDALVAEFIQRYGLAFDIRPYFVNCRCAQRTIYPALPTDHLMDSGTTSLKMDAGLKIVVDGVVVATSDVARTLVRTDHGQRAYKIFTKIIRNDVIPFMRPGVECAEVHRYCVDRVLDHECELVADGLMPSGIDLHAEYGRRNVGHLMGKQESFTTELRPGHGYRLRPGSFGACEIQWPYRDHSIAAEDLWYVGASTSYAVSS